MTRLSLLMTTCLVATSATAQDDAVQLPTLYLDSALRDQRSVLDTPVAASALEGEDLDKRQADTFEELIGDIPGVSIGGGPRAIAQEPNIRGFEDEQIVLRFDGARFNFNQAHRGRFFIDPQIVQRVEVVRGGGSTLFGSGALGGVISVETKDASDLLKDGQTVGARLHTGFSSNGEIYNNSVTVYGDWGAFDALAFLGARNFTDDLEDGRGFDIRNSELDAYNGLIKLGYEPTDEHRIELSYSQYDDEGTTPPNASAASGLTDVERDSRLQTFNLSWDYAPTGSNLVDLSAVFYGNFLEIEEDQTLTGRADKTEYDTIGFEIVNRSGFDMGVPVDLVYGFEVLRDTQSGLRNGAARTQFPDAEATTYGVFAEATFGLSDSFDLIAGMRYDIYERDVDNPALRDVEDEFFSPRIGFSYRPTQNWQIFGNVAQAYRAPTLTELYNDGTHFAVPGFALGPGVTFSGVNRFVPNPALREEESVQYELGTRYEGSGIWQSGDRLSFAANVYYADVKNYINQTVTFIDFSTARPGFGGLIVDGTTTTNNIDAELWGFEAEIDYDAGRWFAGAALSLPRGSATGGLGSLPQDKLTTELGFRPNASWEVGARATFTDNARSVPVGGPRTSGYELLDLYATWAPVSGTFEDVVVRLGVDNVFDEHYQIHPNGLSQPGRTFKVSASVQF